MKRYIKFSLIIATQLITTIGLCQEGQPRASDIFPKDFVTGKGGEATKGANWGTTDGTTVPANAVSPDARFEKNGSTAIKGLETTELRELDGDNSNVVPALSVGALISIQDKGHLEEHLAEVNDINMKGKIPISKVFLVGPTEKSLDMFSYLYKLGFSNDPTEQHESALILTKQRYLPNVPEEFSGVEYSPTWFIDTEFGMILVEGEQRKLKSYFDDKGNFKLGRIKLAKE